jgi:formylglycine-generating enzyme required for sulfatase activity
MKIFLQVIIFSLTTFGVCSGKTWLYYKHYPWVWDNMSKDWLYLQGSSDGKIYAYRASEQKWEEFSVPYSYLDVNPNNPTSSLTVDLNSSIQLKMIWCDPGTFTMESPLDEEGREGFGVNREFEWEAQKQVTLSHGFYLGKYEVTQAQYEAVMKGNGSRNDYNQEVSATPSIFIGKNHPVENVSQYDLKLFFERLNSQQSQNLPAGWEYVLPTSAQWEYACRAGTNTTYSWGDTIDTSRANYRGELDTQTARETLQTKEVGQYAPNGWGFYDMHGNVTEWIADYDPNTYVAVQIDPFSSSPDGLGRMYRGGSWLLDKYDLRSAEKELESPWYRGSDQTTVRTDKSVRWISHMGFRISLQVSRDN